MSYKEKLAELINLHNSLVDPIFKYEENFDSDWKRYINMCYPLWKLKLQKTIENMIFSYQVDNKIFIKVDCIGHENSEWPEKDISSLFTDDKDWEGFNIAVYHTDKNVFSILVYDLWAKN